MTNEFPIESIKSQVYDMAAKKLEDEANWVMKILQDEYVKLCTELAFNSIDHGFDYETMPEQVLKSFRVQMNISEQSQMSCSILMPEYSSLKLSDKMVGLVHLLIKNTMLRYKSTQKG